MVADPSTPPFRVAIIQDFSTDAPWGQMTIQNTKNCILECVPLATVDHYRAADGDTLPKTSSYDLFVLTGGVVNLLEELPSWAVGVVNLVREAGGDPRTKVVGFCWGHQVVHYAFGGSLGWLEEGPRIGVQEIKLQPAGTKFFGRDTLTLHKYHKRVVTSPAATFEVLGDQNEITLSREKGILTFQGHPDLTCDIVKSLMDTDTGSYKPKAESSKETMGAKMLGVEAQHDANEAWKAIVKWARES